ncbi:MAG: hypothetical protein ACOZQL_40555 [Myxococcota bacterium]
MQRSTRLVALAVLVSAGAALALPPELARKVLSRARSLLFVRYEFGGRVRGDEGIDCQGLVFRALEAATPCGFQSFSVLNVNNLRDRELGAPVPGLSPVATAALELEKLEPGDVVWLVGPERNAAEGPIGQLDGRDVWVWHTGLYAGDGQWIVGDHYAGKVVETGLREYLAAHGDVYTGVFVLRMERGPKPKTCRAPRRKDAVEHFLPDGGVVPFSRP